MTTTYAPVLSTTVAARPSSGDLRFHLTMGSLVVGCFAVGYSLAPAQTVAPAALLSGFGFVAIAAYCGWAGHRRLCTTLSTLLWLAAFALSTDPVLYLAGSTPYPLVDQALARYDFVHTGSIVGWVRAHRAISQISAMAYASMAPLVGAALLLPGLLHNDRATRRFLLSAASSTLLTIAIFAIYPAAGPWSVEGYQPTHEQLQTSIQLGALKAHRAVGRLQTGAIVSFPSFHTVLAILSAFALWPIRWLRWPAVMLAAGICISTVTTGWHYGVDVLGGIIVAVCSEWIARRII